MVHGLITWNSFRAYLNNADALYANISRSFQFIPNNHTWSRIPPSKQIHHHRIAFEAILRERFFLKSQTPNRLMTRIHYLVVEISLRAIESKINKFKRKQKKIHNFKFKLCEFDIIIHNSDGGTFSKQFFLYVSLCPLLSVNLVKCFIFNHLNCKVCGIASQPNILEIIWKM